MAKRKPALTIDDLWRLERVGVPSVSPDGAHAVVAVSRHDMDDNRSRSTLWLLSTGGGSPRALTHGGDKDGHPLWSPRGDRIAFVAQREQEGAKDKEPQLYLIAPDGGEARRATEVATGVGGVRWCPDGERLLFVSWVWPQLAGAKAQARAHREWSERKETGYATSEAQYRHWDRNLPQDRVPHLHLMHIGRTADDGRWRVKVQDLFEASGWELDRADPDATHFDVSPDGRRVVFAFDPATDKRGDGRFALAEMDLKTRRTRVVAKDPDWTFGAPRYGPDGDRIAFTASHQGVKHTMPSQLALWQRDGDAWEVVSGTWDHEVQAPLQWEDDGQALLFAAEDRGRRHLWRFDLPHGRAEVAVEGGWVAGFDKRAGTTVVTADSALHPARVHAHTGAHPPLRLERFNDALLAERSLGMVEERWVTGASAAGDGVGDAVQVWLTYPPDFDPARRWPLLHNIHGGPHTGPGDNWHYRWNTQLFAAQGYVVASVNFHGSSGFGNAFLDSITHRWGALELQDVEAATDALLAEPWADARRVFAAGGSYGGFMVAWMNGHVPAGRYQAYVCHAGCFDWIGMFADDAWSWHAKELGDWYWRDMARVQAQSPHAFAGAMTTPTLVIHGALDYRVPDAQGLAYYNTLKARGVDARLLWFPDENHWVLKPRNSRLWHHEFFAWLARHDPGQRKRRR